MEKDRWETRDGKNPLVADVWKPRTDMSLRDYYAGQAMCSPHALEYATRGPRHLAEWAYEIADAMIAARNS